MRYTAESIPRAPTERFLHVYHSRLGAGVATVEDSDLQEPVVQFQRQAETEEREEAACTPAVSAWPNKKWKGAGEGAGSLDP